MSGMFGVTLMGAIARADNVASRAVIPSGGATVQQVRELEDRLDRLALVSQAMWSLLQEKTKLTEEDLIVRVQAIDLMDGVEDGKVTRNAVKCEACGRMMSPRHQKCLYCGSEKLVTSAFDRV